MSHSSPHPSNKLKPITHLQQQQPTASTSTAHRAGESPAGQKRPRSEQEHGEEVKTSEKKPRSFLPLNTFAPSPVPASRASKSIGELRKLPPAPFRAAEHGEPVKHKRSAAGEEQERSALHGNAEAGPSGHVPPPQRERKLKTFTAFQRTEASPRPPTTPKTPVNLKPLPRFDSAVKTPGSKVKSHRPLATPPRAGPQKSDAAMPPPSPPKPLLATPPSARASALFNALVLPLPAEKKGKGREKEGGRSLLESVPPVPLLELVGDDEEEMRDGIPESWSPKKKKGGHVLMGLASRASSVLSSARTAQTLWLHSLSRQLSSIEPLAPPLLAKLLQPKIRLQVVDVLPFGSSHVDFEPQASPSRRDERKVRLARCRMLRIDCQDALEPSSTQSTDEELEGLVMFSLNEHPPASSQIPNLPPRRKRAEGDGGRTVFLPANPHDFRFMEKGAEVWVWEPVGKISLSASTPKVGQEDGEGAGRPEETQPPLTGVSIGVDVVWDERAKEQRDKDRLRPKISEEGRTEWGLVCSRFGIVL